MSDLIQKALNAKRESKYIEFKANFDPNSPGEWCEVVKDIVAIANSGGGIIVFGLDSTGVPTGASLETLSKTDPSDIGNKVSKYTGVVQLEFEIRELEKLGRKLHAFVIKPVSIPIVFQKPGTYDIGGGKQKTAFSLGTVYFRHGAKSEPGTSDDIRTVIERQLESIRKSWIKGVRKIVQAPEGSQIVAVQPRGNVRGIPASTVRAVSDPNAIPVLLTRDAKEAAGSIVYEEVSEAIFDEINNVIDANRVLAKGQQHFFLGQPVYYRIYAERQYVESNEKHIGLLFRSAVCDFYAPALFWTLALPEKTVAETLAHLYVAPKSPHIHFLMRVAVLLGADFCDQLYEKWHRKWRRHAQPPSFYFTFQNMKTKVSTVDPRLLASRTTNSTRFEVEGKTSIGAAELLNDPKLASALLSNLCVRIFSGESNMRSAARNLDYFAYGLQVRERAPSIAKALMKAIGNQEAGDITDTPTEEEY